jgi:hypothetical protein
VDQEKYVTLLTKPIPIEVSQADQLSDKEIALAGAPRKAYKDVEVLREGIYANMTDMSALRDQSVRPGRWFLSFGAMGWLFVLVVAVKRRMGRRGGDKQWRRRAAAGKARRRLQEALTEIDTQNARDAAEHLGSALVGLVADVAGVSETGLTAPEAQKRLEELAVDGQVVQRLANLLDACDRARYGASESALHGLADESQAVLDTLLKALKAKRLLR